MEPTFGCYHCFQSQIVMIISITISLFGTRLTRTQKETIIFNKKMKFFFWPKLATPSQKNERTISKTTQIPVETESETARFHTHITGGGGG